MPHAAADVWVIPEGTDAAGGGYIGEAALLGSCLLETNTYIAKEPGQCFGFLLLSWLLLCPLNLHAYHVAVDPFFQVLPGDTVLLGADLVSLQVQAVAWVALDVLQQGFVGAAQLAGDVRQWKAQLARELQLDGGEDIFNHNNIG